VNLNQVHRGAGAEALGTECFLKRAIVTAWGTGLRRLFCEACIVLRCGSLTSEDEKEKRGRRSPCGSVGLSDRKILWFGGSSKTLAVIRFGTPESGNALRCELRSMTFVGPSGSTSNPLRLA
jgi:hypothetical protein